MLMWWPSQTADIQVVNAPQTWGKRFWLELKTTEWKSGPRQQRHDLEVDLDQLDRYGQQAIPDYYVFTAPPWAGVLHPSSASAWLRGLAPERLAYQSWSGEKWFAEWTFVVPGWALRQALQSQIAALSTRPLANRDRRIAEIKNGALTWVSPVTNSIPILSWKGFWDFMDQCGDKDWPAQFLLPPGAIPGNAAPRADLSAKLQQLSRENQKFNSQVVHFDQSEGDTYTSRTVEPGTIPEFHWGNASRALVALSERAITPPRP